MSVLEKKKPIVARFRAWLNQEWFGPPGTRFRRTMDRISSYASEHGVGVDDLVDMGTTKLKGASSKEAAEAAKNFSEAEQKNLETALERRLLEVTVMERTAAARLAVTKAVDAEFELFRKLNEAGVVIQRDAQGNLTFLPSPGQLDFTQMPAAESPRQTEALGQGERASK